MRLGPSAWLGLPLLAWLATGCLGGAASRRPAGERCEGDDDCRSGLVCAYGACRAPCAIDRDCPEGESCVEAGDGGRVCASLPCDAEGAGCPPDLVCSARLGRCLEPCGSWRECGSGRLCVDGACVVPATDLDCGEDPPAGGETTCEPVVAELAAELTLRLEARTVPALSASGEDLGYDICPVERERGEDSLIRVMDGGASIAWAEARDEALETWLGGAPSLLVFVDINAAECQQPDDCTTLYSAGVLVRGVDARPGCPFAVDPDLGLDDANFVDVGRPDCWGGLVTDLMGAEDLPMPPQLAASVLAVEEEILAALRP